MGFRGLLITAGILKCWHQGNVIPHCLCNPEKLHSKEPQLHLQAEDKEKYDTKCTVMSNTVILFRFLRLAL